MKHATKGALAAVTAVALLSGGAGTLAYWTGTQDVTGGTISSGHLTLDGYTCSGTGLHDWQLEDQTDFAGTSTVVPGDTVTKVCSVKLDLVGDHVGARLTLEDPQFSDGSDATLSHELDPKVSFTVDGANARTVTTPGAHTVVATVTVKFPYGDAATTGDQDVSAVLDAMTLTAQQTHDLTANPSS